MFSDGQRKILLKYFDEFGMTSTHRRNSELIERCSTEVGTTVERVKVPLCCVVFAVKQWSWRQKYGFGSFL